MARSHRIGGNAKPRRVKVYSGPCYELRGFTIGKRGKLTRVRTLTIREKDPHSMAMEMLRIGKPGTPGGLPYNWVIQVVDLCKGKGKLAPLVSYEELVRRAGSEYIQDGRKT